MDARNVLLRKKRKKVAQIPLIPPVPTKWDAKIETVQEAFARWNYEAKGYDQFIEWDSNFSFHLLGSVFSEYKDRLTLLPSRDKEQLLLGLTPADKVENIRKLVDAKLGAIPWKVDRIHEDLRTSGYALIDNIGAPVYYSVIESILISGGLFESRCEISSDKILDRNLIGLFLPGIQSS